MRRAYSCEAVGPPPPQADAPATTETAMPATARPRLTPPWPATRCRGVCGAVAGETRACRRKRADMGVLPLRLRSELSGSGWVARPPPLYGTSAHTGCGLHPKVRLHSQPDRNWVLRSCPANKPRAPRPGAGFGVLAREGPLCSGCVLIVLTTSPSNHCRA